MAVTINVNGLSLVHRASDGVTMATVPDVCKTPPTPTPVPYPNISRSSSLANGTTKVTADGGNTIAVKGSEFATSTGDAAGTAGGVKSGTFMKEAKWLTYSFDVKMEGRNACRLTDKMTCNRANTVSLGGEIQLPLDEIPELYVLCQIVCTCDRHPKISKAGYELRQRCVEDTLNEMDELLAGQSPFKAEQAYDMFQSPPAPVPGKPTRPAGRYVRPDVVIVSDGKKPATQSNLKMVVEIKFPGDPIRGDQLAAHEVIAGDPNKSMLMTPDTCGCGRPEPIRLPELDPNPYINVVLLLLVVLSILIFKRPVWLPA